MLKKLHALTVASVMLISTATTVVQAGYYGTVKQTDTFVNQNFDNLDFQASQGTNSEEMALADGISYKNSWGSNAWKTFADDKGKVFNAEIGVGGKSAVYFLPQEKTGLAADDEIHISFDYMQNPGQNDDGSAGKCGSFTLGLNRSENNVLINGISPWAKDGKGQNALLYMRSGNGKSLLTLGENDYGGLSINNNEWYNIKLSIKLSDEQSIQVDVSDAEGIAVGSYSGKLDSNYTGTYVSGNKQTPDGTYDKYTEFSCLQFTASAAEQSKGGSNWEYNLDNVKVDIKHDVNKYISEIGEKTLFEENFDSFTAPTISGAGGWHYIQMKDYPMIWYNPQNAGAYMVSETVDVENRGKVLAQTISRFSEWTEMDYKIVPEETTLKSGDEAHVSFDYYMKDSLKGILRLNFNRESGKNFAFYPFNEEGTWINPVRQSNLVVLSNGVVYPGRTDYVSPASNFSLEANKWYNVKYIIKTSDADHGGEQTLTILIKEADGNREIKISGLLDANFTGDVKIENGNATSKPDSSTDTVIDKYEALNNIELYFLNRNEADTNYIDNLKVSVISTGIEVKGSAMADYEKNTFTDGVLEFSYLTNDSYVKENAAKNLYTAQYDENGKLLAVKAFADINHEGTSGSIDVDSKAKTIKAFILTDALIPNMDAYILTRAE